MKKRLVHYTKTAEAVASILKEGFLLGANPRGLIANLTHEPSLFRDREPQQFGMVSFTELPAGSAKAHREEFGSFGIEVSWEWAQRHQAQRVIYIAENGPVYEAFQCLFRQAIREPKEEAARYPTDSMRAMAFTNKALAGVFGCTSYAALLTLYEFMQPEHDSSQVEWRIVQTLPVYTQFSNLASALQTARTWRFNCVKVERSDVEILMCPAEAVETLRAALPSGFKDLPIQCYSD